MDLTVGDLAKLTETIWSSVLDIELGRWAAADPTRSVVDVGAIAACVDITGAWNGSLSIFAARGLIERLAGTMYGMDVVDLDDELVCDAFGELANIAGGNIKSMMGAGCALGLPVVVRDAREVIHVSSARLVCGTWLECEGDPVCVALYRRNGEPQFAGSVVLGTGDAHLDMLNEIRGDRS